MPFKYKTLSLKVNFNLYQREVAGCYKTNTFSTFLLVSTAQCYSSWFSGEVLHLLQILPSYVAFLWGITTKVSLLSSKEASHSAVSALFDSSRYRVCTELFSRADGKDTGQVTYVNATVQHYNSTLKEKIRL